MNANGVPTGSATALPADLQQPLLGAEVSVPIKYRKYEASLTFSQSTQRLSIKRTTRSGKTVCMVNIPTWNIVNIVTSTEALAGNGRCRRSKAAARKSEWSQASVPPTFPQTFNPADSSQRYQPIARVESSIYPVSRVDSFYSSTALPHSRTASGARGGATTYLVYYVKKAKGQIPKISTTEFTAATSMAYQQEAHSTVQCILSAIYPRGCKKLLFFISAKSGKGNALSIYKRAVLPVVQASRHDFQEIITTRARHAEDYVADLGNDMSDKYVVVAVGGDGMFHELVNGLNRRRKAAACCGADAAAGGTVVGRSNGSTNDFSLVGDETEVSGSSNNGIQQKASQGHDAPNDWRGETTNGAATKLCTRGFAYLKANNIDFSLPVVTKLQCPQTLPLIATIPAGSGCGMAKTFNVDNIKESVLALVHLNACSKSTMNVTGSQREYAKTQRDCDGANGVRKGGVSRRGDQVGVKTRSGRSERSTQHNAEHVERVACMSCSFGIINDIDHGSEKLRWMGNARFTAYAAFLLLKGVQMYQCRLRYLPWVGKQGQQLQKIEPSDKLPNAEELPNCTYTDQCPHCSQYKVATESASRVDCVASTLTSFPTLVNEECSVPAVEGKGKHSLPSDSNDSITQPMPSQEEQSVDFEDDSLSWVTVEGKFLSIFISNIPNASKDAIMTPYAHLNDNSIDVAFVVEKSRKVGRSDFVNIFTRVEKGDHVKLPFVSYVKARAIELEAIEGDIMIDGEVLPVNRVRIEPQSRTYEIVRGLSLPGK
ncbi:sphingosine kinase A [Trypanosoma brucei equiperdum]|uniref:Sphingosine kinase A n=1 Tax=Trypanosoma brucei equiperdum TaxID=630700 RepID=A0A3L6L8I8_9TRYP|nr:sphingosine kinase A [Trypanosoma brucei equiperdum]